MSFLNFLGRAKHVVKKVGDFSGRAAKVVGRGVMKAAQFYGQNHQAIAGLAQGVAHALPNSAVAQNIASATALGSAALTAMGVGNDIMGARRV